MTIQTDRRSTSGGTPGSAANQEFDRLIDETIATGGARYVPISGSMGASTAIAGRQVILTRDVTIKAIHVYSRQNTSTSGSPSTFEVRNNDVLIAGTQVSIPVAGGSVLTSLTGLSIPVAAGALIVGYCDNNFADGAWRPSRTVVEYSVD